jgi:FG-GAP-like repeat
VKRTSTNLLLALTLALSPGIAAAGQFKKASYYKVSHAPYRVIAAGFTPSGNLDLAFSDFTTGTIAILLGNGDGTFKRPRAFSIANPVGIANGDFNGDGNEDLAVVETGGTGDGLLAMLLGDGKGGFKLSATYVIGVQSVGVAVADFDGDGHLDVAVTDTGFESTPGDIVVFLGDGKGRFHRTQKFKFSQSPVGIAAGDLNGDHHADLAVTLAGSGSVAVFLNDGMGHFKEPVSYNAGGGEVVDVKIADLRNNGKQDLVIANASQGMVVLLNKGDGTFGKPVIYPPTCQNCVGPMACTVADFNLDSNLDVACATSIDDSYLFYGKGNGKFGKSIPIHGAINFQGGYSIAAGDFNNDQAPDLAIPIQSKGKVAILLNAK